MELDQQIDGITVTPAIGIEQVAKNIAMASTRTLPEIHHHRDFRHQAPIAIVGGGPSVTAELDTLRWFDNIMVAGSAHDWLIGQAVAPRWCVVVDPDPIMADYLRDPFQNCTYFVASQCDRAVFDALRNYDVVTWHAGGDAPELFGPGKAVIGGGCTVGTRAIIIAHLLGYADIHLFGFDTCILKTGCGNIDVMCHHAYPFQNDCETVGRVQPVRLQGSDRTFMCADYHIGQLFDFKEILAKLGDKIRFTVHGDGLLAELMRVGAANARRDHRRHGETGEDNG
jgi:uncharacterized Rossmann fold enzyme